ELPARLRERGVEIQSRFQGLRSLRRREGEALGRVQFPEALDDQADAGVVHPAYLDACLQVMAAALPDEIGEPPGAGVYLPDGVRRLRLRRRPGRSAWSHAVLVHRDPGGGRVEGDVRILDDAGDLLVEVTGLRLRRMEEPPVDAPSVDDL